MLNRMEHYLTSTSSPCTSPINSQGSVSYVLGYSTGCLSSSIGVTRPRNCEEESPRPTKRTVRRVSRRGNGVTCTVTSLFCTEVLWVVSSVFYTDLELRLSNFFFFTLSFFLNNGTGQMDSEKSRIKPDDV